MWKILFLSLRTVNNSYGLLGQILLFCVVQKRGKPLEDETVGGRRDPCGQRVSVVDITQWQFYLQELVSQWKLTVWSYPPEQSIPFWDVFG